MQVPAWRYIFTCYVVHTCHGPLSTRPGRCDRPTAGGRAPVAFASLSSCGRGAQAETAVCCRRAQEHVSITHRPYECDSATSSGLINEGCLLSTTMSLLPSLPLEIHVCQIIASISLITHLRVCTSGTRPTSNVSRSDASILPVVPLGVIRGWLGPICRDVYRPCTGNFRCIAGDASKTYDYMSRK